MADEQIVPTSAPQTPIASPPSPAKDDSEALFSTLVTKILNVEGGYTNDPKDPGGETNHGVTIAVARENGYAGPMKSLTKDQAISIYRSKYWIRSGFYLVARHSRKLAEELLDTGVNMGVGTASVFLQRALNALNREQADYADIPVDGGIGTTTINALKALLDRRGAVGERVLLRIVDGLQLARYVELAERSSSNERFVLGWVDNRIGNV